MRWVKINKERDNYPKEKGVYLIQFSVGSINPKIVYEVQHYYPALMDQDISPRFSGEFDWTRAIQYLKIPKPTPAG